MSVTGEGSMDSRFHFQDSKREKEKVTEEYVILDQEGQEICHSRISKTEGISELTETKWIKIHSWFLINSEGVEVDMFQFLGVTDTVYESTDNFSYVTGKEKSEFNHAIIPKLNSPQGISTALHEFGHMRQHYDDAALSEDIFTDENKMRFNSLYIGLWPKVSDLLRKIEEKKEKIKLNDTLEEDFFVQMEALYSDYKKERDEYDRIHNKVTWMKDNDPDLESLCEQGDAIKVGIDQIDKRAQDLLRRYELRLRTILNAPTLYLEKDATKRAFQWMRQLKDNGIHLYSAKLKRRDVVADLNVALKTYHIGPNELGNIANYYGGCSKNFKGEHQDA